MLEDLGIATVCIMMRREAALAVMPPRTLFVKFPMGAPLGPAGDDSTHMQVIHQALDVLACASEPGMIVDSPFLWKR